MLSVDAALAKRIEMLGARELETFHAASKAQDPASASELMGVAGGIAGYFLPGSPLNHAVGVGFDGPFTDRDAELLERFYGDRGETGVVTLSPLAHGSVLEVLGCRGWTLGGFESVLVRELAPGERFEIVGQSAAHAGAARVPAEQAIEIVEAHGEEQSDLWAQVASYSFSAPLDPLPEQLWVAALAARRPASRLFLAYLDGVVAGTGELTVHDGIAWLSADATVAGLRRRGVQQALQRARLAAGVAAGCSFAVSEAHPATSSQRNMERLGFHLAYTRVELVAPTARAALGRIEERERGGEDA